MRRVDENSKEQIAPYSQDELVKNIKKIVKNNFEEKKTYEE